MAVTIIDNRTVVNQADSLTGWTANADGLFSSAPDPVEATDSIGTNVSNETQQVYFTAGTSADLTNTLFYVWAQPGGVLDTTLNGGVALILGDGTNTRAYHVGGSDASGFRHADGPVFWQCFVIDTGSLPTNTTQVNGTGDPTFSAITEFGIQYKTLARAVGNVENCFTDIMRYGNSGIIIRSGTAGDPGKFSEIATADRQTGNLQAYGIFRQLGAGLFGAQGPLTFGAAAIISSYFADTNSTVVFEDRGLATDKYGITIQGAGGTDTTFILGTRDDVGLGSDGCSLICPVGVGAFFDASDVNVNEVSLYSCTLSGFTQGVTFSSDATLGPNHEIFASSFIGCSQITIGTTEFKNNTISDTTSTGTAEAAVLMNSTTNVADLTFISGGSGHAIEISDATNSPFSISGFDFQGYATSDGGTGNEVILNTSGSPITINVTDTSGVVSVDTTNSTGTVTIVQNVTITVTVVDVDGVAIQGAVLAIYNSTTDALIINDETDVNGEVTTTTSANQPVYIRVRKSTTGSTRYVPVESTANTGTNGFDVSITLAEDLIVSA